MLNPFVELIVTLIQIYTYIVLAWLILSWLISFNVINRHQPAVQRINYALFRLTEPVLRPIRNLLPDLGGIDISPIILLVLLNFASHSLVYYSIRW